jgi:molybdate transport system ATP-binding protein
MIVADIHKKLNMGSAQTDLYVKLKAEKGTITLVHGPSGAGKTTFLKVLAGLMLPENGKVTVDGDVWLDTATGENLPPQKRKAGFVFQNYALFPNMTVRQQLQYATKDELWIDELLTKGQLQNHANHNPDHLSGGQQQRLAILRAMANKPRLLLMDEPFSALDRKTKTALVADLKQRWNTLQTTVIIVSHNPQELEGMVDQDVYIGE